MPIGVKETKKQIEKVQITESTLKHVLTTSSIYFSAHYLPLET